MARDYDDVVDSVVASANAADHEVSADELCAMLNGAL